MDSFDLSEQRIVQLEQIPLEIRRQVETGDGVEYALDLSLNRLRVSTRSASSNTSARYYRLYYPPVLLLPILTRATVLIFTLRSWICRGTSSRT